jgi:transcriptional regulator with XRE-family HTH domain
MDGTLFDQDVDRPDPEIRSAVRRAVLGGVVKVWRTRKGWSVNDSAAASGMAPMTWRRVEQGMTVRRHAETQIDKLLGQPFGTIRRALDDDPAMVSLSGIAVDAGVVDDPAAYLDELAERFRSGTVPNGITAATRPPSRPIVPAVPVVSAANTADVVLASELVAHMVRGPLTEAMTNAIASVLAALPDMLTASAEDTIAAVSALGRSGNATLKRAAAELAERSFAGEHDA